MGRYSEMTYVFDILRENQQFELLFNKGIDKVISSFNNTFTFHRVTRLFNSPILTVISIVAPIIQYMYFRIMRCEVPSSTI